ncbi:MAG: NAD-dependent succinate-semialdehyde dehydrogenase [Deferrisomatales bacterium]|nr:NAD-dependent succinate-semialdehyde dehydrogenase [Deferrisomatales bacterium]
MTFTSVNPNTGRPIRSYPAASPAELERAVGEAGHAFRSWRRSGFPERSRCLREAARLLRARAGEYARLMAEEMGKPVRAGRAEAEKCAWVCEYVAERGPLQLAPEAVATDASRSFVSFQPLGSILAIMPWNFPFWQVFRFAAPNLMAGNAALLKHAPNVPGCALALEQLFRQAGFPKGLFRSLLVPVEQVGALIEDPRVQGVTLTGSVRAGREVARQAGQALKKTVLELGGSDPYVVLSDADVEAAARTCVESRLTNSGQSCIAAKRLIVVECLRAEFEARVVEGMGAAHTGDPLREDTDVGPLAREDLRRRLHRQVAESVDRGARCLLGGQLPAGPGFFYPPTVLTEVASGMPAYEEELFGPVAAILSAKDDRDAVRMANDTAFGLGAAVFTGDPAIGESLATEELQAGCCFVNASVRSDPRLPFGGIKRSGYGRELSAFGIREFVNIKTVWVA